MATKKKPVKKAVIKDFSNCYTVRQASQILGLSPKRVRQLITEGKLKKLNSAPVMVEIVEVLALREQRENNPIYKKKPPPDQVAEMLEKFGSIIAGIEQSNTRAIEAQVLAYKINEENYLRQINELRADLERARARRWYKRN